MDITMKRGDSQVIPITITNTDGTPRDLTGATVFLTCKVDPSDVNPFFQRSITNIQNPTLGVTSITIGPEDTQTLTSYAVYVYDIELSESSGQITTIQSGKLIISLDVTV